MSRYPNIIALILLGMIAVNSVRGQDAEPKPAVRVRLSHADEQLQELLDLFGGAKSPSPAAALAAWKRAIPERNQLGKPLEALIAALNPRMIGELKALEKSELSIQFDSQTGQPEWSAILPNDDGTFAALASAFVLTGGAADAPMGELAVDRLAGPASPLMARFDHGTLIANSRETLRRAKEQSDLPRDPREFTIVGNGLSICVERRSLKGSHSLVAKRLDQLLSTLPGEGDKLIGEVNLSIKDRGIKLVAELGLTDKSILPPMPLSWFDWTPKDRAMFSFGSTVHHSKNLMDSIIDLVDSIERLDITHAQVAPLKLRLDLLGRMAGLQTETDLLMHLLGVSGWVGTDDRGIDSGLLVLYMDEVELARRIFVKAKVLPGSKIPTDAQGATNRLLGAIDGKPLRLVRVGGNLFLAFGEGVFEASQAASINPQGSAGPEIRKQLGELALLGGMIWPAKFPRAEHLDSALFSALAHSSPIFWKGVQEVGDVRRVAISADWPDLDRIVKRFLELIPLDPPTDH